MPDRATTWPSVTPVPFRQIDGVVWRDGKPRCASHQDTCLVRAAGVGAQTDGGTHVCARCMRAHNGRSES